MNRLVITAITLCLMAGSVSAAPQGLDGFGWKNRVLVIFASPGNPDAAEQRRMIAGQTRALAERDLVVLSVSGDTVERVHGRAGDLTAAALRADAGIGPEAGFAVVLVGKDGGIKLRSATPVTANALFGLIDAMPMRAREAAR